MTSHIYSRNTIAIL